MAIDVRTALSEGADDLASLPGFVLYLLFTVFSVASIPVHHTLTRDLYTWMQETADVSPEDLPIPETPAALDISVEMLVLALVAVFLVSEALRLIAVRSFASDSTDAIPLDDVTHRLGSTFLSLVVAGVIIQALVYGGAIVILPAVAAIFLSVFVRQAIALDDEGAIQALKTSVSITVENPVSVLVLLLTLFALSFVVGIPTIALPTGTLGYTVTGAILGTVVSVYGIAVVTRAYEQVRGPSADEFEGAVLDEEGNRGDGDRADVDEAADTGDALDPRDLE